MEPLVIPLLLALWGNSPTVEPDPAPVVEVAANRAISAEVRGSLEGTISKHDREAGPALAAQVARLIRWRGDMIRDVHPKDRLHLVYEPTEPAELVALVFDGQAIQLEAYRFRGSDGIPRFYDRDGRLVEPAVINTPVPRAIQITETVQSGSGKRRHHGLDLKAPEGTPIRLPFDGRVSRVNWSTRVNGNCVEVYYSNGTIGRFLHLSKVGDAMYRGAKVSAGARVGLVGNTGRSGAPHLHYEVRSRKFDVLDPLKVHGTRRPKLKPSWMRAFRAARITLAEAMGLLGPSPIERADASEVTR